VSLSERAARLAATHAEADSLTIGELYRRIDRALQAELPDDCWVAGEVRSFNVSSRGHCYLDLVDPADAQESGTPVLKAKCWSSSWRTIRNALDAIGVTFDAGLVVRVRGKIDLYKPRGEIGFIVTELDTEALLGKVAAERARLVKALVDEGLFDRNRQLAVPVPPVRVGLVASPATEGYRDFMGRLQEASVAFEVLVAPSQVQGRNAPASVAAAIRRLDTEGCDVLVVVRGGGSKADLATFDAEVVARAIATAATPVWTGIGHTGDQSVADEVANRSFITPTECGQELARQVLDAWRAAVDAGTAIARLAEDRLLDAERSIGRQRHTTTTCARAQLDRHADRLEHRGRTVRGAVRGQLDTHAFRLAARGGAAGRAAVRAVRTGEDRLVQRRARLEPLPARLLVTEELRVAQWRRLLGAFDYQRQLDRGYSVTRDASGAVLRSVAGLDRGTRLVTQLADGSVASEVTESSSEADGPPEPRPHDEGTT
jgi:exodeoxyribonuclease VII large subunit